MTFMLPCNEWNVAVLACCYQCGGHLDPADVPWLECEDCGRAWLVGEAIIERIDLPDAIKGRDCQHDDLTLVFWDGHRENITADEIIPADARSMEFIYERRSAAELLDMLR